MARRKAATERERDDAGRPLAAARPRPEAEPPEAEPAIPEVEVLGPDEPLPASEPDEVLEVSDAPLEALATEADAAPYGESVSEPAEARSDLVRYDPLEAYLREIRAYPSLSREEEVDLAVRYQNHKDLDAAYRLVTSNLWLVVKIARDYERAARGILDLIQEGNIGLMEAVKNFDPYRGVRFPSYAAWWVKAYIVRYLIANWRMVKIGTTQAQRKLFFNLKKEKDRLEREGFFPAPKLLADKLNVKESEVVEMEQRLSGSDVSVDAPLGSDSSDSTMLSVLPMDQASAEDLLDQKQTRALLEAGFSEFATTLNPKERIIFEQRMLSDDKATLQEIADKLSLSRERIRQIENRLREKLKAFLQKKLGTALESMDF